MTARTWTYSFLDVLASLVGPGVLIEALGAGAGPDEEGLTIEQLASIDEMTIGADGSGFHSLIANQSAKITVRLLKTSPVNEKLALAAAFQRTSAANHGQNTLTIANRVSGDVITCEFTAFEKIPQIDYSKVGKMVEWTFNSIVSNVALGSGPT